MSIIFVSFFVAILNDSYEEAKENTDRQSEESEMCDFILRQLVGMLRFGKKTSDKEHSPEGRLRGPGRPKTN